MCKTPHSQAVSAAAFLLVGAVVICWSGTQDPGGPSEAASPCASQCPARDERAVCHFALGVFLVRGTTSGLPACVRGEAARADPGSPPALLRGIAELELASRYQPEGSVGPEDLAIIRAGALTMLARWQIIEGQYPQADRSLAARGSFIKIPSK